MVMVGIVAVVCLPMLFMGWLLLAVSWTKMDTTTMRMPEGLRSLVVQAMLEQSSNSDKVMVRAEKIDLKTADEWHKQMAYRASHIIPLGGRQTPPQLQALYDRQIADRKAAKALAQQAKEDQQRGRACAAEDLYAEAGNKDQSQEIYQYTEGVGRAGLQCGDLPGARAGLEAAILKQTNFLKGTDEDQLGDVRRDRTKDREFLVVVYEHQQKGGLAAKVCAEAHTGWKGCACALGKDGDVSCQETR
jgi:hypothetical protein